jgi:hypothetical protein
MRNARARAEATQGRRGEFGGKLLSGRRSRRWLLWDAHFDTECELPCIAGTQCPHAHHTPGQHRSLIIVDLNEYGILPSSLCAGVPDCAVHAEGTDRR